MHDHSTAIRGADHMNQVSTAGYAIIALALIVFVQATNVYPQLLLGRLLFSLGGSAAATMVTAILPAITGGNGLLQGRGQSLPTPAWRDSLSSEAMVTPARSERRQPAESGIGSPSPSRLAGFVGLCTGSGALIALAIFLPLPARFENVGFSAAQAIRNAFYCVAAVALVIALWCFFGLKGLSGEGAKGLRSLWTSPTRSSGNKVRSFIVTCGAHFIRALRLCFKNPDISLGYIGGFVARASSVGISLFVPLFINRYYRDSDLCKQTGTNSLQSQGLSDIKKSCPEAYIAASILTGVSQLVALITAPAFGYLSDKSRRLNVPLLFAALVGIVAYVSFPQLPSHGLGGSGGSSVIVLVTMGLIGISQIGAIVCSLGVLSNAVLNIKALPRPVSGDVTDRSRPNISDEHEPLLNKPAGADDEQDLLHVKGSIAGIYSLYGGAGILILTKLGGLLFDKVSSGAPFYIMAGFNGVLLVAGVGCGLWRYHYLRKATQS